ncbi:MAG: hypothetical protein WDM96_16735 [Lacunisphaera sp.]
MRRNGTPRGVPFSRGTFRPLLLGLLLLDWSSGPPLAAEPVLLLDATRIEQQDNIRIAVGQAEKSLANPLFGEDRSWEPRFDNMYPNVTWDKGERIFKCWYNLFVVEVEDWIGSTPERMRWLYRQSGVAYATSHDGLHWEKPALDLLPYHGAPSNLLLRDVHGAGVFRDEREPRPERRYKLFGVNERDGRRTNVAVRFSPDGVHWENATELENIKLWADTHNNAFWAPTLGRYVALTRDWDFANPGAVSRVRLVARTESGDFLHWSDPQVVLRGLDDNLQVYAMPVFYHGGVYLGLPAIFDLRQDRVHVELAWSKDTVTWHRVEPGTPLIANGTRPGDYDWGCVYPAASPILTADGVKLFYAGSDGPHYGKRRGSLALATLRPDGFAAATPADPVREGTIVSTPISFQCVDVLLLTADTGAAGSVQVALMDAAGRKVAQSVPLTGSFTARPVEWSTPPSAGRAELRLCFTLKDARLYSYEQVGESAAPTHPPSAKTSR